MVAIATQIRTVLELLIEQPDCHLTMRAAEMAIALINRFGSGEHPVADFDTLPGFKVPYINKLIRDHAHEVPAKFRDALDDLRTALGWRKRK